MLRPLVLLLSLTVTSFCVAREAPVPAALSGDVSRAEPDYGWKLESKGEAAGCGYWHLKLTSQKWQGIVWTHELILFRPDNATATDRMLLVNEGGGNFKPDKAVYGAFLATKMKAPVAVLLGVPNQPLFDGKREDDLIAETFVRYLETQDASWPLLFPMVKSVVKAMDATGEFTAAEWGGKVDKFLVTGSSKRGWTSWLTAAADPRVVAIAPMVIDVLNIPAQLPLQVDRFGKPSEQIGPYTKRGLVPMPDTAASKALWEMVDPYSYRSLHTMPKLILLGNNDPYWSTDALNLYWDALPGDKYISYTPNAGHNLIGTDAAGKREALPSKALEALTAFTRAQFSGKPLPGMTWKHGDGEDGTFTLSVTTDIPAKQARLWVARSETKDFRKARWEAQTVDIGDGKAFTASVAKPASGYISFYADVNFTMEEAPYWLSTQIRLAGVD